MQRDLKRHPDFPCGAVSEIAVEAEQAPQTQLRLRYLVAKGPAALAIPPPAAPARTDGLWRHTCFEAFIRALSSDSYFEFNLSPSGEWAAYRFSGYREGMAPLEAPAPRFTWAASCEGYELTAELDLSGVPELADRPWELALTAVIEETDGRISYWALAHPAGKPDFHAGTGFALSLPET